MSGTVPALDIAITGKDQTGPAFDSVGKRLTRVGAQAEKTGQAVARVAKENPFQRVEKGFTSLASTAGDAYRSIDRIAPAMGAITGAASIAGMTLLVQRWSQLGQQAQQTGQRLGLPTDRLTALRGAARLAGASAEDLDGGLANLDERLRGAVFRGDAGAIQTFNQLGVGFRNIATGGARNAADALGDVAEGIKKLYDSGEAGRGAALRAAQNLGLEALFPMLLKGKQGIADLQAKVAGLGGVIPPEAARRADALASSYSSLEIAIEGVANRTADRLAPAATSAMNTTAEWIGKNKELADSYGEIGTVIAGIGAAAFGARLLAKVGRFLGLMNPAAATVAALGAAGAAAGAMNVPMVDDFGRPIGNWGGGPVPQGMGPVEQYQGLRRLWRNYAPTFLGGAASSQRGASIAPPAPGTAAFAVMQRTHDFWASKGFTEPQIAGILAGGPAAESNFNPDLVGDNGTSYGLYQHHAERLARLRARYGDHPTVDQQNQFAWDELNDPTRRAALTALRAAPTAAQAAGIWTAGFEVPAHTYDRAMERAQAASRFEGAVNVSVDIRGAPAGTTARVTSTGPVTAAPPRVETAMQGIH